MFLNKVIENGPIPLLTVARVFPSGESAIPYGLGALTFSSAPTGVMNRPFGKTAPLSPPKLITRLAGKWPAGALRVIAFESPPGPPWPSTRIRVGRTTVRSKNADMTIPIVLGNRRMGTPPGRLGEGRVFRA